MLRYEIKKVFSKSKNRIAVIVLFVILAITSILTINRVEYVDENGNSSVGISAARDLREAKNQWAGYLTADTLSKVLEENRTINSSKEALSDDITEQNKAYAKKQGIAGIMDVIIYAFSDYRDYNYYVTDQISDPVFTALHYRSDCRHPVFYGTRQRYIQKFAYNSSNQHANGTCKDHCPFYLWNCFLRGFYYCNNSLRNWNIRSLWNWL